MPVAAHVETLVADTFARLGEPPAVLQSVPVVSQSGRHLGREFESGRVRAIWLFDHDVIVFCRKEGGLLRTVGVREALAGQADVA